ncbi:MAG: hypothetical protein ACK58T_48410, partial [Phycisphaerae bacterium]
MTIRAGAIIANGGPAPVLDAYNIAAAGVLNTTSPDAAIGSSDSGALAAPFACNDDAFCPADLKNDGVVDDFNFEVVASCDNILDRADSGMPIGCS